jgi:WD40 repeat protein
MTFDSTSSPFVGLRPFESDESLLFFGRQEQTVEILQRLHQYHFVAITGGSGSGKSSIIKAGLIPRLKAGYMVSDYDRWVIVTMKPGQNPLYNLSDAILTQPGLTNHDDTINALKNKIEEEGVDAILNVLEPLHNSCTNFFLLVDQFEELFRFAMDGTDIDKKDEAIDFVNILLQLSAQTDLPIYVVITMRSDFIGDCAQFYGLPEALNKSQYVVPRLNRIQLETTIESPVRLFNGKINPGLIAKLLNDAQTIKDELPLLQHALMRIWNTEKNIDKNGELDLDDYKRIGGIEKALSNHADEAMVGMSGVELNLTKKIFQALTTIDENGRKVRRPAHLSELELLTGADKETLLSVIYRFIEDNKSFLVINQVEDKNDLLIDISHESLIRQWSTLNTWVDEEAESGKMLLRLSESARLYNEKKKDLLSGNELHQLLQWYYAFQPDIIWAQRYSADYKNNIEYLQQSEKEEKKQHIRKRRNRRLLLVALIFIITVISVFAFLIYKNNIENKRNLALNYWKSSQAARSENDFLGALHFIGEAANLSDNEALTENLLIDGEAYLPHTSLRNIIPQPGIINSVVFSADGQHILIAGNDGIARIVDKQTGIQIGPDMKHSRPINSAVFSPDGKWILTAVNDNTAGIWEVASGKQVKSFLHSGPVIDAVFSPDGTKILTASADSTARVWDATTGNQIVSFRHEAGVTSAVFSPDATRILTTDGSGVRIWNISTQKQMGSLNLESVIINAVFSPDAKWILTSGRDSTASLWDAVTMKQITSLKHGDVVTDAIFSPDGRMILSSSRDKAARLWDVSNKSQIGPVMKHEGPVYSVAFSADGTQILTAGWDKTIRLWDIETAKDENKNKFFKHRGRIKTAVFSGDGTRILTASNDSTAGLWDVSTGIKIHSLKLNNSLNSAVFSPDGTKIVTACDDSTARVWDASTGKEIDSLKLEDKVNMATFSPNGKCVLIASKKYVRNWEMSEKSTEKVIDSFSFQAEVNTAVFSVDGKTILVSTGDSSAHIIDVASGKLKMSFKHFDMVNDAVFSPNGNNVLTASWDKTARLWDAVTGKQIGPAMKHDSYINSAVFSSDGKWIVTGGWDSTAHIWNTATLKEIGRPKKSHGVLNNVVFSPDGKWILASGYDSTARLWPIEGDLDLPFGLFELQAKSITGVGYNAINGETECMPEKEWRLLKEKYNRLALEHYKICKYPHYNLWKNFNKKEAEQIRPNKDQ